MGEGSRGGEEVGMTLTVPYILLFSFNKGFYTFLVFFLHLANWSCPCITVSSSFFSLLLLISHMNF